MRERTYYSFQQPKIRGDRTRLMSLRDVTPTAFNWQNVAGFAGTTLQSDAIEMVGTTNQITLGVSMTSAIGLTGIAHISLNSDKSGIINSIAIPITPSGLISCAPGNYVWFEFNSTLAASSTVTVQQQLLNAVTLDTFTVNFS